MVNRKLKRKLILLLAVVILVSALPITVSSDDFSDGFDEHECSEFGGTRFLYVMCPFCFYKNAIVGCNYYVYSSFPSCSASMCEITQDYHNHYLNCMGGCGTTIASYGNHLHSTSHRTGHIAPVKNCPY